MAVLLDSAELWYAATNCYSDAVVAGISIRISHFSGNRVRTIAKHIAKGATSANLSIDV